jgi:hypothetical protein
MKKALMIFGGLFLALFIALGGVVGYGLVQGRKFDAESKAYVSATLPRVLADPSASNFFSFIAPEDKAKLNAATIDQFALKVSTSLGQFQSFDDLEGRYLAMYTPGGADIKAKYLANCHFEKGSVTATITVRKIGETWSLMGVFLNFDTLKPNPAAPSRA